MGEFYVNYCSTIIKEIKGIFLIKYSFKPPSQRELWEISPKNGYIIVIIELFWLKNRVKAMKESNVSADVMKIRQKLLPPRTFWKID